MMLKKKSISFFLTVIFLTGVGFLIYYAFAPNPIKVERAKVIRGDFEEIIRSDGILRSKDNYIVTAYADGDIKRISLKVGDLIKQNQKITELFWDSKYEPVKAPLSGVISKVFRESAGPIRRGEPMIEIIDPLKLEVMAELLTTDAVRLSPGAPVKVENWGGSNIIKAKITRISKAGFKKLSALGVEEERTEVTADLTNFDQDFLIKLGSTFHVDVTFQISETHNGLKIPIGALFRDQNNWAVYIIENNRAKKKQLEISALNPEEALVKSGLSGGEEVIVYPGDLVKEGSKIE